MMTASSNQPYIQGRRGANTGGFVAFEGTKSFKKEESGPFCQVFSRFICCSTRFICCGYTHSGQYEPSPVFSGVGLMGEAMLAGYAFLVLHFSTLVMSGIVLGRYEAVGEDLTTTHETDFILNFVRAGFALQLLSTLFTALYFGLMPKAYESVLAPYICLLLQLCAAVMMMLVFNWIITAKDADKNMRPTENDTDSVVAGTAFCMLALVATHITPPITGVYTKINHPNDIGSNKVNPCEGKP